MPKVRIGILGCGRIVQTVHLPMLCARADVDVVAIAEPSGDLRAAAAALVPGASALADWREVLPMAGVDAIVIALPNSLHADAAVEALRAGKHIYLEKPIATTMAGAQRIIDAWRHSRRIAVTGFNYRYHPLLIELRRQIQSGRIGDIVAVRGVFGTAENHPAEWKRSRNSGGGALLDLASHHIDLLRHLLSAEIVSASARILSERGDADTATLDLQLTGGIPAQLLASFRSVDENRLEVFGTRGKLSVDCYRSAEVDFVPRNASDRGGPAAFVRSGMAMLRTRLAGGTMPQSYQGALTAFVASVASGSQPECDLNAGLASLAVIDAAERSMQTGAPVVLETATEHHDRPANHHLPTLSVIAVTNDCLESLQLTIRHLAAQTIHRRIELVISAPRNQDLELDDEELRAFHSVQICEAAGAGVTVCEARVPALRAAHAPIVVFAEDHSFPEPGWAEAIVAAHAGGAAAAGPQIRNANPQRMMSWADLFLSFGPWVEPRAAGPVNRLPWHNSAYDRNLLLSLGAELPSLIENEGILHDRLRSAGRPLVLLDVCTRHVNISSPRSFCLEQYHGGRLFGGARAKISSWSLGRRLLHVAAAPLIPWMRLPSILQNVRECGRTRELLPGILPALMLGLHFHALGEAVGIAFGSGNSVWRKSDMETHRERFIPAEEARAIGFMAKTGRRSQTARV